MDIVSQIREEVKEIVNSKSLDILTKASNNLAHNHYLRLRRGRTLPSRKTDMDYILALEYYTRFKISLSRCKDSWYKNPNQSYWESQATYWRKILILIENGEPYFLPSNYPDFREAHQFKTIHPTPLFETF